MQRWSLDRLGRLRCRVVCERLGDGPLPSRPAASFGLSGAWADHTAIVGAAPLLVSSDPFAALAVQPRLEGVDEAVVGGGWFGWISYDGPSRLAFHDHVLRRRADGWYFEALWSDERAAELQAARSRWGDVIAAGSLEAGSFEVGAFGGADRDHHLAAVEQAVADIRAGDIYQVNVCTRLRAEFAGDPVGLFERAVTTLRPRYGAYLADDKRTLISLSPELFLRRRGREVTAAPIKGTAVDPDVLRDSAKDAAENVMIVDLMRNDLGRVCETGTVRVASLLDIEPHPGVWHLVSRVTGRLRPEVDDAALLAATFPPGSVTGAPKSRAVQVIAALEPTPRGAYTGAIGFASPSWGAEFSVAIRTFEVAEGRIELGVGGGITADSVPMLEWRECLHKAAPLLAGIDAALAADVVTTETPASAEQVRGGLLETLLAIDGRVLRLADHLARLDRSCHELYRAPAPPGIGECVAAAVAGTTGRFAVRVRVSAALAVSVTSRPAADRPTSSRARVVARHAGLWRHKWADRAWADAAERNDHVPLFVGADGAVLETSRGNVFVLRADGTLVTPPLRDDLLPGITRRALLDLARDAGRPVELRAFGVDELHQHAAFWTSSLSLAVPIHALDGVSLPRADFEISALASSLVPTGNSVVR